MRMGSFLRDGGSLHQSAVDVPIDLAIRVNDLVGIILRDDRNGFLFAPWGLEAKPRIGLCCMAYGLLTHRSHWLYFFAVAGARFFVIAFIGLSGVLGADFCVIT